MFSSVKVMSVVQNTKLGIWAVAYLLLNIEILFFLMLCTSILKIIKPWIWRNNNYVFHIWIQKCACSSIALMGCLFLKYTSFQCPPFFYMKNINYLSYWINWSTIITDSLLLLILTIKIDFFTMNWIIFNNFLLWIFIFNALCQQIMIFLIRNTAENTWTQMTKAKKGLGKVWMLNLVLCRLYTFVSYLVLGIIMSYIVRGLVERLVNYCIEDEYYPKQLQYT